MGSLLLEPEKFCCRLQEHMFINLFFHYDGCFFVGGTG